jgi:hypothetical protein
MKPRNLIILALVVMVIGAYIMLVERHRPNSDELEAQAEKLLQDFDRDDVTGIVIERDAGRIRLEKVGEDWHLREPLDFPADHSVVGTTLGSLAGLEADRRLPVAEVDAAEFGLDRPAATVILSTADGSDVTLTVGDELPLGSKRVLRLAGDDEIVIAAGGFMSDIGREVDGWRSREVVDIAADQVAAIDIGRGGNSIRAVRLGDDWKLLQPLEDVADRDHLQGLVSDLDSMRIEEFLDGVADPAELGLDAPSYEVLVVRGDGDEPFQLALGVTREDEGETQVACRRGDGEYFWASDRVTTRLSKAPVLWRSKKVAPFETWDVEGLVLTRGEAAVDLSRSAGTWQFADGGEADLTAVQERLRKLADLEATDYDLVAPPTAELGRAEIEMEADDDSTAPQILTFTFFEPLAEGGRAAVRVSGRDTVMGVELSDAEAILDDFEGLRPEPVEEPADETE